MKTVSVPELAQRVAQELSQPEASARAVIDRTIDVIRKELQRGNRIELANLLTVHVRTGQAVPAKSSADAAINLPPSRLVQFELDETLRKKIEGSGQYQILLVVPKRNFFTGVMAARLTSARTDVTVMEGETEAIEYLKKTKPDLVVLDANLAAPYKVCEQVKKTKESSLTAIVRVMSEGEQLSTPNLQVLPDEKIVEPFELSELVKLAEAELARSNEMRNYFEQDVHFQLATTEENVEEANDFVGQVLAGSGLAEDARDSLQVAFREALDNAARHGNKYNENRNLDVQFLVDREKVTVAVTDEGEGFDTEIYLSRGVSVNPIEAARERSKQGGAGGLGIMLMLKCVDKIEYNYAGNKIILTKFIHRAPTAAA